MMIIIVPALMICPDVMDKEETTFTIGQSCYHVVHLRDDQGVRKCLCPAKTET